MIGIGLALGAGGARGLAHIHALRAFDSLGIRPTALAGTSMGALIGAAYCAGLSGDTIADYVSERLDNRLRLMGEVFKIRPNSVQAFLDDGGLRIGELNLERILSVFLPAQVPQTFDALSLPLKVVATDYYGEQSKVFDRGPLRAPLAASACMPAIFLPVQIDGVFLFDGSATNPCPVDTLQGMADHVLGIDVAGGTFGDPTRKPKPVDSVYAANQMMQRTMAMLLAERHPSTRLLRAPVERFRPLDFLKAKEVLSESQPLFDETKRAIDEMLTKGKV